MMNNIAEKLKADTPIVVGRLERDLGFWTKTQIDAEPFLAHVRLYQPYRYKSPARSFLQFGLEALTKYSMLELVELAGSQGVVLLNLLVARGALSESVTKVHSHYYVPISNTDPTFVLALRP